MPKASLFPIKLLLFLLALLPMSSMMLKAVADQLGPNPVETLSRLSGLWALRFLLITLALTPFRLLFNQPGIIRFRRMLGLFTFFYSSIHLAVFVVLEHSLSWRYMLEDIYASPTVDTGLLAYVLLIPLALTSSNRVMQKLGKLWKKLHVSVYLIAMIGLLHFVLSEKADYREPLVYGGVLFALFVVRVVRRTKRCEGRR